jgi:hypothetical protein
MLALGLVAGLSSGCLSHSSTTLVDVHATAVESHPVGGREVTTRAPLFGYRAIAVAVDGSRTVRPFDRAGIADLRLAPGRYTVLTSFHDACRPATVVVAPGLDRLSVTLQCAEP